ncbi:MAG: Rap1a/Tai family immunity protein [Rickettsiales bacterium]
MRKLFFLVALSCATLGGAPAAGAQTGKSYRLPSRPQDETLATDPARGNVTAADLAKACGEYFQPTFNNRERLARKSVCASYFYGALSALFWLRRESPSPLPHCAPDTLSADDGIRAFLEWSESAAEPERYLAIEGALKALDARFPCRTPENR